MTDKSKGLDELKALWNAQCDEWNSWDDLGLAEIVAFAQEVERAECEKVAQAASEKHCAQRDYLLRVLQHITCEPINAEYMAQEAIDAIAADKLNRWDDLGLDEIVAFPQGVERAECEKAALGTAAIAWGWLWHVTTTDDRVKTARSGLGQMLNKDLKRYGIETAREEGAQVNVQEIEAAMLRGYFGDA